MNSFIHSTKHETFDYVDIDNDDNLLRDGDAPIDEIVRAYVHFTRTLKLWPRPSFIRTRWAHTCFQGKDMELDGEHDCEEIHVRAIELRDFNDEVLALYEFPENDRMRVVRINHENKNLRSDKA